MKSFLRDNLKEIVCVSIIFIFFLALRIPGVSLPYHQDEFKTAISVEQGSEASASMFAHPPLTQLIYRASYSILGSNNLRFYPIFFSSLSFFLLYCILRKKTNVTTAYIGIGLFSLCFYSVWSSLMLDTDGAMLPFFFLASVYTYEMFSISTANKKRYIWLSLLLLSLILGFLVKLSFVLVIGALAFDYLLQKKHLLSKKYILYISAAIIAFAVVSISSIFLVSFIYPAFQIGNMIQHAESFVHIGNRDYIQIIVQAIKAIFYLSPLVLILLMSSKEIFSKMRVQYLYIILGFVFYFILFDFSRGALDKYLMYLVVPVCMIAASLLEKIYHNKYIQLQTILITFVTGIALFGVNFVHHNVLPLYPKTYWFSQVLHFKWNFLNPFMGGSGPLGFYISFLFVAVCFLVSIVLIGLSLYKKEWRVGILSVFLGIVLLYNAVFIRELLWGSMNGNSSKVLHDAISFIQSSQSISSVITYNDTGAYELSRMGKYAGRFYAVPAFEDTHRKFFDAHKGYFLIIDMPHINPELFHGAYFKKCDIVYESSSGRILGRIYTCSK